MQAVATAFDPLKVIPEGKHCESLEDLAGPGRFSQALHSSGFVLLKEIPAKKGSWTIYKTPEGQLINAEPLDCLVATYVHEETFWREQSIAYLLMSRPGSKPNREELEHNVGIITSGLLEKSSRSMDVTGAVAGAVFGFLAAYAFLPFDVRFNDPSIPITGAGILNVTVPIAAAVLGGLSAGRVVRYAERVAGALFARRIPDLLGVMERHKYAITAEGAFIAATSAVLITKYATHYDPAVSPDKLMLGIKNFGPLLLAAGFGGLAMRALLRDRISNDFWPSKKSPLSNPEQYIYGPKAARALTQEIAYATLARSTPPGQAPVSRELFRRAIETAGGTGHS